MKILIVNALPLEHQGGAEISLRHHINNKPPDVNVDYCLPDNPPDLNKFNGVVIANLRPSGGPGELAEAAWAKDWVKRVDNYQGWVIKSERDIHPCAHRDGRCINTNPIRKEQCDCSDIIPKAFERLYNSCDTIHLLSPAHQQVINQLVRIKVKQYVIAPPIDFTLFRLTIPFEKRKKAALILGDDIRVSKNAELRARDHGYPSERLEYNSVPHNKMPELLNQYQAVVVDPVMFHAFGRLAIEALACGCHVLASERVGSYSWPDPLNACRKSNELFWQMILRMKKNSSHKFVCKIRRRIFC